MGWDTEERAELLRAMAEGDALSTSPEQVEGTQHWTSPPPRYTEASLVKRLEEEGIGRPSTYAPIMRVLLERAYVRKEGKKLVPESRGRILTSFLGHYFPRYVDYQFRCASTLPSAPISS
jgi:DNA topoisomerase-1